MLMHEMVDEFEVAYFHVFDLIHPLVDFIDEIDCFL